jgi:hypothetical protein
MRYLTREKAAEYLNCAGVPVRGAGLKDHANRGTGPEYALINGRALYTQESLDRWVADQAARPVLRRRAHAEQAA